MLLVAAGVMVVVSAFELIPSALGSSPSAVAVFGWVAWAGWPSSPCVGHQTEFSLA